MKEIIDFRLILTQMSSLALGFNIFISCFITLLFLYRCGNYRRQHPITTIAVFISWAFSVMFVFLLPLDISLVRRVMPFFSWNSRDLFPGGLSRM